MTDSRFAILVIVLLALFLRVYKIGGLEIGGAWDEGYGMIAATHVLEDRTFLLIPHMPQNDGIILDKPPVLYYLGALSMALFGQSEGSVRAVTILFGALSVIPFYLLIGFITRNRRLAILSACILAFFPVHIAISRTFMVHVPALFFALTTLYLLIRGIDEKKTPFLVLAGAVTAANLLTDTWFGMLPVAGAMGWKGFELLRSGEAWRTYRHAVLSLFAGLLIFLIWPLSTQMLQNQYVGIYEDCYPPDCTIWNILSVDMVKRMAVKQPEGKPVEVSRGPVAAAESLIRRFSRSYWAQGHFNFSREFDLFYKIFFYGGLIAGLAQLGKKSTRSVHLFFLFWAASYLPIHMGRHMYTQYIILMVPFFSFYVALAIYEIHVWLEKISGTSRIATLASALLCCVFFAKGLGMIQYNREYLYKTHYREIAAYLNDHTVPTKVVCENQPGLSFYLKGECVRRDKIEDLAGYVRQNHMEFADLREPRNERILLKIGCRGVNDLIPLPKDSEHHVFDCRGV